MELSALRLSGLIAGVCVIAFAIWRRRSLRNVDVLIILFAGLGLILVSATNVADAVLEFFDFQKGGGRRILGLAVFAIFILFLLTLRSLWQIGRVDREVSAVLEGIAWEEFRTLRPPRPLQGQGRDRDPRLQRAGQHLARCSRAYPSESAVSRPRCWSWTTAPATAPTTSPALTAPRSRGT